MNSFQLPRATELSGLDVKKTENTANSKGQISLIYYLDSCMKGQKKKQWT